MPPAVPPTAGRYVYALSLGAPDLAALGPATGIDGAPLEVVVAGDVAAVTSALDPARLGELAAGELRDDGPLADALRTHDDVTRAVHAIAPVVPLRFGTLCRDVDAVRAMLAAHAERLRGELERLAGTGEWTVRIFGRQPARHQAGPPDEEAPTGRAYLAARAARQAAVASRRDAVDETAAAVHATLGPLAEDWADARVQPRAGGDAPVAATSFLVSTHRADEFASAAAALAGSLAERGFDLSVSGPWPPYRFSRVRELVDA